MSKEESIGNAKFKIEKYNTDESLEQGVPDNISEFEDNIFLNEGIDNILSLACGSAGTAYNSANAGIGVGDSTVATAESQTGLQGSSTAYSGMMSGYPQLGSQNAVFKSEFGSSEANFEWNEFTVSNSLSNSGDNWNRKVANQGTKADGSTWRFEVTLSIVNP